MAAICRPRATRTHLLARYSSCPADQVLSRAFCLHSDKGGHAPGAAALRAVGEERLLQAAGTKPGGSHLRRRDARRDELLFVGGPQVQPARLALLTHKDR